MWTQREKALEEHTRKWSGAWRSGVEVEEAETVEVKWAG